VDGAVVDTNVAMAANGSSTASLECELAAVEALRELTSSGHLLVDSLQLIYREYLSNLGMAGRTGPGSAFVKWVHDNQWNTDLCTQVGVSRVGDETEFAEFPDHGDLASFDRSDRKFVAVACAHEDAARVLVAIERGWWIHRVALADCDVTVCFLCPKEIEAIAERRAR
jgi:hypothetical protein